MFAGHKTVPHLLQNKALTYFTIFRNKRFKVSFKKALLIPSTKEKSAENILFKVSLSYQNYHLLKAMGCKPSLTTYLLNAQF